MADCPVTTTFVPGAVANLEPMSVPVHQAGGGVEQVEQSGRLSVEMKRRQHADGNLLVAIAQPRFYHGVCAGFCTGFCTGGQQLEPDSADLPRGTLCQLEAVELGRSYEGFRRDSNC